MSRKIFISYRREDSKSDARSIYQRLEQVFGPDQIFIDVDTIRPGEDFGRVLDKALAESAAQLVIIGNRWLAPPNNHRLFVEDDFVRREIAAALARQITVIPITVDGSTL